MPSTTPRTTSSTAASTAASAVPTPAAVRARPTSGILGRLRAVLLGVLGLALVAGVWEAYKALAPDDGVLVGDNRVLPRTTDLVMPHVWDILQRLGEGETAAPTSDPLWRAVLDASLVSLGIATVGFVVGTTVGLLLALLMARVRVAEWGLLPWIVLSQTIPLIAFAPVVRSWGSRIEIGGWEWPPWMSVALIGSYLAFVPVAVGALRGLQSPARTQTELMHSYAAGWWATLVKLRIPASVPYLIPALRLGAAGAVVGTVVAEVSTAYLDGIGRPLFQWPGLASFDPEKAFAPIFGAVAIGLVAAAFVGLLGGLARNYRRGEAP